MKGCPFFFRFLRKSSRRVVLTLASRRRTKQSVSSCWSAGYCTAARQNKSGAHLHKDSMRYEVFEGRDSLSLSLSPSPLPSLSLPLSFFPFLLLNGWSGGVQPDAVNLVLWCHWMHVMQVIWWRWRTNFTVPRCIWLTHLTLVCEEISDCVESEKGHVAPDEEYLTKKNLLENKVEKRGEEKYNENAAKACSMHEEKDWVWAGRHVSTQRRKGWDTSLCTN